MKLSFGNSSKEDELAVILSGVGSKRKSVRSVMGGGVSLSSNVIVHSFLL